VMSKAMLNATTMQMWLACCNPSLNSFVKGILFPNAVVISVPRTDTVYIKY
jgi:hypothetical protein